MNPCDDSNGGVPKRRGRGRPRKPQPDPKTVRCCANCKAECDTWRPGAHRPFGVEYCCCRFKAV